MRSSARLAGIRVLIVEDHDDSRDALRQMLEWLGATVCPARTGADALTIAASQSPDLVLCDLRLPDMDGLALLGHLRARATARALPIVAVTGFASQEDRKRTSAAGFDGHLVKPLDYELLVAMVEDVLGSRPRLAARRRRAPTRRTQRTSTRYPPVHP